MVITIVITVWHLWAVVAASWGIRGLLRCGVAWVTAPRGTDWRAIAWRCQWEGLGVLGGGVASLWLLRSGGGAALPGWCCPLLLALLGLRALLDLPPLVTIWRGQVLPRGGEVLRWRSLLVRLRCRQLARSRLPGLRPMLLSLRPVRRRQHAARRAAAARRADRAPRG